ncbi:MAG: Rpn family recombination-promoting nuclease/putative transposase [Oscillospiraceae bacterium]|nr:Rpn family recombination-promoting nuclease/putative transposase [Oscillospiraceae bacterium]
MESKAPANRQYKSSLFDKLFSTEKSILTLYNALSQSQYPLDTPIEITTLDDVLYRGRYNDLSFTIDGKLVVLVEQQSTINNNMPARLVLYYAKILERYIKAQKGSIYSSRLINIPRPEFIVLYNGTDDYPDEGVLKLSDAFFELPKSKSHEVNGGIEITARVLNINKGHNTDIVQKSVELDGYVDIFSEINKNKESGMTLEEAIAKAVKDCASRNILTDFLEKYGGEVMSLLYAEWDWDEYVKVQRQEAAEESVLTKMLETAKKLLGMGDSVEKVSAATGLPYEKVKELCPQ